ncbi:restriction endonuclease subunit S [Mycoplasma sp. Z473B]|uniref:restriction endonuclease subunit S n=1 Tax=Mycoplasma sp. Z473B TaxID=3401667 RepID=UPI003AAFE884
MQKEKLVPEIRFKGFDEDWRNKKIESFGIWLAGTSLENQFCKNGSHKVVNIGSFGPDFMYKDQGLRINLNDENKHFLLNKDDLVMILNDKTLEGRIIGSVLLIDKDNTYLYNQRIQRLSIDKMNYNPHYLFFLINNMGNHDILYKKSQGNTQIYLNWSVVSKINFLVSNQLDEQQKIGAFFSNLDSLIQSQELKLKKLNEVRQSFLSKMLASKNQKFPEIRFKGFDDEWVKFKLGDIGIFNSNGVDKVFREKDNVVHMVNYMDVYNKVEITLNNIDRFMITTANNSELIKNNLIKGDILFTPSSETIDDIGHTFVVHETIPNLVYSYHLVRFRPNSEEFDETFANYCLDQKRLCDQYMLRAQGVQRFVLNREHFNTLSVIKPSILEQKKINKFLFSLDSLIHSQELKLEKLNNIKQALLEKMFC